MAVQQAASYPYDAFVNGLSFILSACLQKACMEKQRISRREYLWIMILTVLLAPVKNAYLFLLLLFLAIPTARYISKHEKYGLFLLLGICAAAFILLVQ